MLPCRIDKGSHEPDAQVSVWNRCQLLPFTGGDRLWAVVDVVLVALGRPRGLRRLVDRPAAAGVSGTAGPRRGHAGAARGRLPDRQPPGADGTGGGAGRVAGARAPVGAVAAACGGDRGGGG